MWSRANGSALGASAWGLYYTYLRGFCFLVEETFCYPVFCQSPFFSRWLLFFRTNPRREAFPGLDVTPPVLV